ncbi:MAG: LacI family DNA-binding transcriptional regulator [Chitinophagaceae bacterium]|nr:LacI family DNA-binding transcriptional regulator [Chitinophagaceae bacterium]
MGKVDLRTLAARLNLSMSTVSRALGDKQDIGASTKKRVLKLARELNYQPNAHAAGLRHRKSKTIGVVVPEIANNFFSLVIDGIHEVAHASGYHVLVYLTHESLHKEINIARHIQNGRVDGLLISISSETVNVDHLREVRNAGLPIVFFDRVSNEMKIPCVTTNDYESAVEATHHLLDAGCKNIVYFSLSHNLSINGKRMKGYLDALRRRKSSASTILQGGNVHEENVNHMIRLLSGKERPDGVFACVEELAIATYEACAHLGLQIPRDVKVICFSNMRVAPLLNPSLTTVRQPALEIGKEAAATLVGLIESNKKSDPGQVKKVIKSDLIERRSTAIV